MTQHQSQIESALSTDSWKHWEGQVVNGEFPLHRYLGGSRHSAVFLTNRGTEAAGAAPMAQTAAIKLVLDVAGAAESQLKHWELAAGLSHPHLIDIFHAGRCQINGVPLLYVVMEYAEEDLSPILPQRALTPSETREMLRPSLEALAYLHGMGLVHGHVKPSNVMACADRVKLSVDTIRLEGEPVMAAEDPDRYRPPEPEYATASDSWALGMTLVEVLTQQLPLLERAERSGAEPSDPAVPSEVGEPFLQIARGCLRGNPALRLKTTDIKSLLDPSEPEPLPLPSPAPQRQQTDSRASTVSAPSTFHSLAWLVAVGLFLSAIGITSIRSRRGRHAAENATSVALDNPHPQIHAPDVSSSATAPAKALPDHRQQALQLQPHTVVQVRKEKKVPLAGSAQPGAVHQVLPEVPQKIRNTIRGTVRVNVKVAVNAAGRVSQAELASPGPSRYFADRALQAARQWTFPPATQGGPDEWLLHFSFSSTETQAHPVPAVR